MFCSSLELSLQKVKFGRPFFYVFHQNRSKRSPNTYILIEALEGSVLSGWKPDILALGKSLRTTAALDDRRSTKANVTRTLRQSRGGVWYLISKIYRPKPVQDVNKPNFA
jgi:hypothetical protein